MTTAEAKQNIEELKDKVGKTKADLELLKASIMFLANSWARIP